MVLHQAEKGLLNIWKEPADLWVFNPKKAERLCLF